MMAIGLDLTSQLDRYHRSARTAIAFYAFRLLLFVEGRSHDTKRKLHYIMFKGQWDITLVKHTRQKTSCFCRFLKH